MSCQFTNLTHNYNHLQFFNWYGCKFKCLKLEFKQIEYLQKMYYSRIKFTVRIKEQLVKYIKKKLNQNQHFYVL